MPYPCESLWKYVHREPPNKFFVSQRNRMLKTGVCNTLPKPETGTCLFPLHISIFPAAGHRLLAQYSANEGAETRFCPHVCKIATIPVFAPQKPELKIRLHFSGRAENAQTKSGHRKGKNVINKHENYKIESGNILPYIQLIKKH